MKNKADDAIQQHGKRGKGQNIPLHCRLDRHLLGRGVGPFELKTHAGAREIRVENAVDRSGRAIEKQVFDASVIVKVFEIAI